MAVCKGVSVYGCVSRHFTWSRCAHIENNKDYQFLQCLDLLRGSQSSTTHFIAIFFPKNYFVYSGMCNLLHNVCPITPPRQSMGVLNPNSRGRTKACESLTPTQGATSKHVSP